MAEEELNEFENVMRFDGALPSIFQNAYTGQGTYRDRSQFTEIRQGRRLNQPEIDTLYEHHWMVQNLIDILPDECTREWIVYQVGGDDGDPKIARDFIKYQDKLVDDIGDEISVVDIFNEALRDERRTGGAIIYMDIDDGREPWEPVDENKIKTINYLQEFDRYAVTPEYLPSKDKDNIAFSRRINDKGLSWDMSKPTHYRLNWIGEINNLGLIHRSRVLRFGGAIKLSYKARQNNQGWGISVAQSFIAPLQRYNSAVSVIAALVPELIRKTWKIEGLWQKIAGGKEEEIRKRVAEGMMLESVHRRSVIDKDKEELEESSLNLEGAYKAVEVALDECVAASNLPRTYLLGVSPAGKLGVSGGSEQTDMLKTTSQYQKRHITRPLNRLHNILWLAKDSPTKGKIPDDFRWRYVNPYPMSEKEKADLFSLYAGAFSGYISSQVLMPDEVAQSVFGGAEPQYNIALNVAKRKEMAEQQDAPPTMLGDDEAENIDI